MSQRHLPLGPLPPAQPKPRGGRTPYRRGAGYERELQRQFQADGLLCLRSASSRGPFDLAVIGLGGGRLIQCKAAGRRLPEATIRRWLAGLPAPPEGWTAELWVRTAGHGWRWYRDGTGER